MFLARMVMPRSRSRSLESRMQLAAQLALAEQAGLAQHLIDQRRLAVIDVGDDGDIAEVSTFHCVVISKKRGSFVLPVRAKWREISYYRRHRLDDA